MELQKEYEKRCCEQSDINELLPTLYKYAKQVNHITEFGVRDGNSTVAFAATNPGKLISYDLNDMPVELLNLLRSNISFVFIKQDVLSVNIELTELLFIDTLHTYDQLIAELNKFQRKVKKYILMHDTVTFGDKGEDGNPGLLKAIDEFLKSHREWSIQEEITKNNGLTVLKRGHINEFSFY